MFLNSKLHNFFDECNLKRSIYRVSSEYKYLECFIIFEFTETLNQKNYFS